MSLREMSGDKVFVYVINTVSAAALCFGASQLWTMSHHMVEIKTKLDMVLIQGKDHENRIRALELRFRNMHKPQP